MHFFEPFVSFVEKSLLLLRASSVSLCLRGRIGSSAAAQSALAPGRAAPAAGAWWRSGERRLRGTARDRYRAPAEPTPPTVQPTDPSWHHRTTPALRSSSRTT